MILPSKHLSQSRALINVGAEVLAELEQPTSISELWDRVRRARSRDPYGSPPLSFDWFVLCLSFLHAIRAIALTDGVISTGGDEP